MSFLCSSIKQLLVLIILFTMSIHCDALMAQEPVNSEPSLEQALDQNLNNGSSAKTSPQDNVAPGVIKDSMLPGNGTTIPPAGPDLSKIVIPPNDPCLPVLYNDWQELSKEEQGGRRRAYAAFRIFINRTNLMLTFEGLRRDNMFEEIYSTHVGLGEINSPTPEGTYIINHIYCYPDVLYFDPSSEKIPGLYNGFFAPLLVCDKRGRCARHRDLGIHGYNKGNTSRRVSLQNYGYSSAGCVRVPDPCKLKSELIRYVGIGTIKQNERGSYHWLSKPITVVISDTYPDGLEETTLASIFQESLNQVQGGIKELFSIFGGY